MYFLLGLKCYVGNENQRDKIGIQDCSKFKSKFCIYATSPSLDYFVGCNPDIPDPNRPKIKGLEGKAATKLNGSVEIAGGLIQLKMCVTDLCNLDQGFPVK